MQPALKAGKALPTNSVLRFIWANLHLLSILLLRMKHEIFKPLINQSMLAIKAIAKIVQKLKWRKPLSAKLVHSWFIEIWLLGISWSVTECDARSLILGWQETWVQLKSTSGGPMWVFARPPWNDNVTILWNVESNWRLGFFHLRNTPSTRV